MSEQQESSTILDNPVLLSALEALAAVAVKPIKNQGPYYTEKYALQMDQIFLSLFSISFKNLLLSAVL